jgi:hypothetical protein
MIVATLTAGLSGCGYRPCGQAPTRLLGPLVSQASIAEVKSVLQPSYWAPGPESLGPTDGRPPYSFREVDAGDFVDLGHRGQLRLVCYNGRLSSALFTPDDAGAYFAAVQRLPGATMLPNAVVSLGSNTRVGRRADSVEWLDACMRADQDSWISVYACVKGLPNKGLKLTSVERIGRSQLNPGVRPTMARA